MLVNSPSNEKPETTTRLGVVKAGKIVELESPEGKPAHYMVCRSTEIESVKLTSNRIMLVNIATGRVVFKLDHLPIFEVSCETSTHYLATKTGTPEEEEAYENRGNR